MAKKVSTNNHAAEALGAALISHAAEQCVAAHGWIASRWHLLWPLSFDSAPVWIAVCVVLGAAMAADLLLRKTPGAIRRARRRKGESVALVTEAVLRHAAELARKADASKRPEASRLLQLLWDDTLEVRTRAFGVPHCRKDFAEKLSCSHTVLERCGTFELLQA